MVSHDMLSSGDIRECISDRDVGKHSVRGAVLPSHCTNRVFRLHCHCPAEKSLWPDCVQLLRDVLCIWSATDDSQSTSSSCTDFWTLLQNCGTRVCCNDKQCNVVWRIHFSWCLCKLLCILSLLPSYCTYLLRGS